jgi:prophage tail gpP-like protein
VKRAIDFLREVSRGVGLIETRLAAGEILFSRSRITSDDEMKKVINSLDSESEIETAQEIFLDDEPDDDFEND